MSEQPVVIEGADNVKVAALIALAHALVLEISTGMKVSSRTNLLHAAISQGVVPNDGSKPRKKTILRLTVDKIKESWPDYEPNLRMRKAMG
jgi:hypothetical protein